MGIFSLGASSGRPGTPREQRQAIARAHRVANLEKRNKTDKAMRERQKRLHVMDEVKRAKVEQRDRDRRESDRRHGKSGGWF